MLPLDHLLALALLTGAPESPVSANVVAMHASLKLPLQALAVQWEILDPRELRYILARREDFVSDLNLLRRRQQELADAPPLADCLRFPERATVNDLLSFNRAYRQHMDVMQPIELVHSWEVRTALQETDHLYQIWDAVRDTRCEYYYVNVRRQQLKRLRELVGDRAYYSGNLPPCVPFWRFRTGF
jgi:hypothetical protein